MATRNPDAVANQGEFHARRPRDEPLTTHGHKPGVLTGNDAAPEFKAKTLPPGSAPADRTFTPNATSDILSQNNPDTDESTRTSASDTLGGATSGDVHAGLGKPLQGQTSTEVRHDGQHRRKNPGQGLVGVGASGAPSSNQMADERVQPEQRALDKEEGVKAGTRGDKTESGAEDLPNEKAENL